MNEIRHQEVGKPHGYGEWKDSELNGETCGGMFSRGTPTAPFLTFEKLGQGAFRNERIGYATISGASANDMDSGFPRFISSDNGYNGLCFGVAEVECCVSGTFYYNYPRTNYMSYSQPPFISLNVKETWLYLMQPYILDNTHTEISKKLQYDVNMVSQEAKVYNTTSITYSGDDNTKNINMNVINNNSNKNNNTNIDNNDNNHNITKDDKYTINNNDDTNTNAHTTSIKNSTTNSNTSSSYLPLELILKVEEVLIFIPGFNSFLYDSLKTYGQFLQLGGFPNTISPFLFGWPQVSVFIVIFVIFILVFKFSVLVC